MITTKSYSKDSRFFSAYISALKAQLPFAIVSGIIFLILFIVVFFANTVRRFDDPISAAQFFQNYFRQGVYVDTAQSVFALVILAVVAFASTLMGMSYLHKKSTVDLYHSLPVTRPQLLTANLLATLTAVLVPFVTMHLLTMIIQLVSCARYGCFSADYFLFIFFDIASAIIYTTVIAAFTAFIAVNVGTVFDAFSVAVITGFTPPGVFLVSGAIWQSLIYGAYFQPSENILLLSPFLFMFKRYFYFDRYPPYTKDYTGNAWLLLLGIILAAAFFALAVVCYRRRKSEIAEQTQPRGVLQIIVKLVAAFVGGAMFYAIFSDAGFVTQIIALFTGAVGVGLISELILSRGVKWLGKNYKLLVGAGVAYCLILILVRADVFGYASRLPAPDSISGVQITYNGRFGETDDHPYRYGNDGRRAWLTDPESIAIIRDAHSMAIENRPVREYDDGTYDYAMLNIEYKLKNGATMKRMYHPVYSQAHQKLAELEDKDDFIRANSTLFWAEENPDKAKVETVELYPSFGGAGGQHANVLDDPDMLLEAIRADMLEQSLEDILSPKEPALGLIFVNFKEVDLAEGYDAIDGGYRSYRSASAAVVVTREYKRTIEVLKRLDLNGGFDDGPLNLDGVVSVGLVPASETYYYVSGFVRTFMGRPNEDYAWELKQNYVEDDTNILTFTDAESITAVAKASKDTLFTRGKQDWDENYAIAYFEMADGSIATKAVRLSELPADILGAVRNAA